MDLISVCRVCLQYSSESNSFCDEVEYDVYIKLADVFKKVTDVEVLESEDEKPCRLCQECTERLLNAYDFMCAVEKAELEIENFLKSDDSQIQEELEQLKVEEDTEIDTTEIETHEIEILEEEFETEQEQELEQNDDDEDDDDTLIIIENVAAESSGEIFDNDSIPVRTNCTKRGEQSVGSRLSKRLRTSNYKCSSCQRSFAKIETLERHIKTAHTALPPEELANISSQINAAAVDDKRITCSHCPQMFKRRNNYIRHLTASHPKEVDELADEDKELVKSKHNYKRGNCPYCGKNFTQASLKVHIRRHTGENPYQCDQCEKAFPRRQDLVVHQRKHTGEKPHMCTICGKSFSRANKLARHMRVHTGERPYKCTKCQRSFAQSNDLKIHMRRHTGEKPYKCSVCSEAFICGAALKTHRKQKNHHSAEDEYDDPFANWRVCKRDLKTNNDVEHKYQIKKHEELQEEEEVDEENETKLQLLEILQE